MVHNSLIVLYSLVIILGIVGNIAILVAFFTNKVMLTTRNIFIANLAISDILLCSFTMPLTLVDLLTKVEMLRRIFHNRFLIDDIPLPRISILIFISISQISFFGIICYPILIRAPGR